MIPGTWQHVLEVALIAFLAVGVIVLWPKKRGATRKRLKNSCPLVDYSAARAKAIEWLGDDYLLAKPINRIHQGESS